MPGSPLHVLARAPSGVSARRPHDRRPHDRHDRHCQSISQDHAWDALWQHYIRLGDEASRAGDYQRAGRHYVCAWREARIQFREALSGGDRAAADMVPMLVVSASNVAENWARRDDPARAQAQLQAVVTLLVQTLCDRAAPRALHNACFAHLDQALAELVARQHAGSSDDRGTLREIGFAKEAALSYLKTLHAAHELTGTTL